MVACHQGGETAGTSGLGGEDQELSFELPRDIDGHVRGCGSMHGAGSKDGSGLEMHISVTHVPAVTVATSVLERQHLIENWGGISKDNAVEGLETMQQRSERNSGHGGREARGRRAGGGR